MRAAVRVLCVDGDGRTLLLRWRDPDNDRIFWEPPGGGVEAGETPLEAARRELYEETGLAAEAVEDVSTPVDRYVHWLGEHHVRVEPFFLARFEGSAPVVRATAFTPEENDTFVGHGWFSLAEMADLDDVDPQNIPEVLGILGGQAR